MLIRISRLAVLVAAVALGAAACSSGTSTAPPSTPGASSAPATVAPHTAAPSSAATPVSVASAPASAPASVAVVATVPSGQLEFAGKLVICSDIPYPPQEFFDDNGNPVGSDIDLGTEIAKRLGLQAQVVNSVFDTIIAAVTSGKCDIIMADMNITADRQKQISMIQYFQAGQSMLVAKGNPQNINTTTDMCGQSVAAESGTTEVDYLQGTGDYKGKGLPADCAKAGKKNPTVVVAQKDTDALQQLQSGKVAVYFADSPVAAYYTVQHPDQFQIVGQVLEPIAEGIGVPCGAADCTNAPLSPLGQAVKTALDNMKADGTYLKILTKFNLASSAVK